MNLKREEKIARGQAMSLRERRRPKNVLIRVVLVDVKGVEKSLEFGRVDDSRIDELEVI
jgi:hypothetical protein